MRSRKLLALIFSLLAIAPALAGYMTLLGAGVGSIQPAVSWVSTTDPTFPNSSLIYSGPSLSTMFDSTGKLTYKPNNLALQSNTFTNAVWTAQRVTVAAQSGYYALTTTSTTTPVVYQTITVGVGGNFVASFDAQIGSGGSNFVFVKAAAFDVVNGQDTAWFNLSTGVVSSAQAGVTASITDLGSGWYRCAIKFTTVTDLSGLTEIGVSGANGSMNASAIGDVINIRNAVFSAVTYETTPRTGDQVITTSAAYYGPRIDYDPNTLAVKGLLIEEARTNIVLQNRDLTNAAWTKGATATVAKDQTGIDGVSNSASSFTGGATSGTNTVLQSITLASSTRAQSAWVKRLVGSGVVNMTTDGGTTWNAITLTASWTQVQFTQAAVTNPNVGFQIITNGDKIAIDFVQNETGTFATSVLQTAASSITRAADVVQFTGAALTALQGSAGSVIIQSISEASSSPAAITNVIKGTNSILYRDTTDKTGTTNGTTALLTAAAPTWSSAIRNGLAWSASGRSLGYTSGSVATDANTVSNGGTLYLGSSAGSAVENGWYQSFGLWNQRLSDATLSTKLTVGGSYAANDNGVRFAFANDNLPVHWRVAL